MKSYLLWIVIVWLGGLSLPAKAAEPKTWRVLRSEVTQLRSPSMLADSRIRLTLTDGTSVFVVATDGFTRKIEEVHKIGPHLIVLGRGISFDEVMVIDIISHALVDRAIGYGMHIMKERWLVTVEWYPNHVFPPQFSTDTVLLRDFSVLQGPAPHRGTSVDDLTKAGGLPVFPEEKARLNSYANIGNGDGNLYRIYPKTFTIIKDAELAFVYSRGIETEPQVAQLGIVDLDQSLDPAKRISGTSMAPVYKALNLPGRGPIEIDSLGPLRDGSLRIHFVPGAYDRTEVQLAVENK